MLRRQNLKKSLNWDLREKVEIVIDNSPLSPENDLHSLQKRTYLETRKFINEGFRSYINSKEQLLGIIKSMTDKQRRKFLLCFNIGKKNSSPLSLLYALRAEDATTELQTTTFISEHSVD